MEAELERVKGIEPSYAAWEAAVLPLNYTRADSDFNGGTVFTPIRVIPAQQPECFVYRILRLCASISPDFIFRAINICHNPAANH